MPKKKITEPTPTPRMDWNGSLADFKNVTVNNTPAGAAFTNKGATYTPPANAQKSYTGPNLTAINKKFESSKLEKVGNVIGEASGVKDLQRVVDNPTKENIAYTIENNLFVNQADGKKIAITENTDKNIVSGQTYARSEFGIHNGIFWSPKGTLLAFAQKDESEVADYPLLNINTITYVIYRS